MKKKILSLLVTGCLLFVPTTAFADDNKTVIKTVDDLLAFVARHAKSEKCKNPK